MQNEIMILFWWLLFGGSHVVGSTIPVRNFVMSRIGMLGFKAVYSLVALATFGPLCYVYFINRHAGDAFYLPGYAVELLAQFLMLVAIIVLLQGLVTPNPMTTRAELSGTAASKGCGIQRITRHPQNFAFGLFGLAHFLANPYLGDWIFFGGFILFGIGSSLHQDRRYRATGSAEVRQFLADTSAIPFAAIINRKQRLAAGEFHPPGMAAAVLFFILLRLLHPMLFGGFGG